MTDPTELETPGRHYTLADLAASATRVPRSQVRDLVVHLEAGESVDRVATTKGGVLWGPAVVEVIWWPDGGVEQRVWDRDDPDAPEPVQLDFAGRRNNKGNPKKPVLPETLMIFGETKPIAQWVYDWRCKVTADVFRRRLRQGGNPEWALTTPTRR